jgi:hypothetical protein
MGFLQSTLTEADLAQPHGFPDPLGRLPLADRQQAGGGRQVAAQVGQPISQV